MTIVAALDLGSNTVKMTVARKAADGTLEVLFERANVTRIGEGLDKNGYLLDAAIERTFAEVSMLVRLAKSNGATVIRAVGTAGLRGAANSGEFLERVRRETGVEVEIIDGMREADLAFRAPASAFGPGPVVVIDLGGRSTEIIAGVSGNIFGKVSLEVGSVRLTERCLPSDPPTLDELAAARAYFRGLLEAAPAWPAGATLVGVSSTVLALLGLEIGIHEADQLAREGDGQMIHRDAVERIFERFRQLPAAERVVGSIIPSGRADVIVAGMLIVAEIMDKYQQSSMRVTGRGVRYGLLFEMLLISSIRISAVNDAPIAPGGKYVLYWMNAYRRLSYNHALERAAGWARELRVPLVVLEALRADYPWASDRHHAFIMDGMREHEAALARRGVGYYPHVERDHGQGRGLVRALAADAAVVVTDDWPCFFLPRAVAAAGAQLKVKLEKVDSAGLLPLRATDRAFPMAHGFRRYLKRSLRPWLDELPVKDPLRNLAPFSGALSWPAWPRGLPSIGALPINHAVGPVAGVRGGASAGRGRWRNYLGSVTEYGDDRSAPTSGLSPYLHHGQLSPYEIIEDMRVYFDESYDALVDPEDPATEKWGWASPFVEQLVTWREIGLNMCARRTDYAAYASLPDWARATLEKHESDPRTIYSLEELEGARTADPVWNAAQRQLVGEGVIHTYLRMLWGKKILEWSPSAGDALEIMVHLNNKYALDGRDPSSYSGIFWILGRYDRPWPERPIYGMVRTMSSAGTKKKLDLRDYLVRWGAPA